MQEPFGCYDVIEMKMKDWHIAQSNVVKTRKLSEKASVNPL